MGEVAHYLDASFLVALLVSDPLTSLAAKFAGDSLNSPIVSNLTGAEFASAISRRVRIGEFNLQQARTALSTFDDWMEAKRWVEVQSADFASATSFVRQFDLKLRTPDALHLAVVQRIGATLVTFDVGMTAAARMLFIPVADL